MTTWERRDRPVLEALTRPGTIEGGFLAIEKHGEADKLGIGLTNPETYDALLALMDAGYVSGEVDPPGGGGAIFKQLFVTGRGMQVLGEWPWFAEPSPATLAALLERLSEETSDEAEAADARRAASYIASVGADVVKAAVVAAGSTLLRGSLGL